MPKTMPYVPILIALRDEIQAAVDDADFGFERAVTVRHHRFREASSKMWPCVSIRRVSSDPASEGRQENAYGLPEEVMELTVDLVIDMAIPPEIEEDDGASPDHDPTGYGDQADVLATILDRLFPGGDEPENTLGGLVWQMRYDGSSDDDGVLGPDQTRMEERLTILYRVRADRPTELLTGS